MTASIRSPRNPRRSGSTHRRLGALALAAGLALGTLADAALAQGLRLGGAAQRAATPSRSGDHIVAVVNSELVTNNEVQQRLLRLREEARRGNATLPPEDELRQQVLDALIDERVQITFARDSGYKVDEAELDRAVAGVAQQNQLTVDQLRERLKTEGLDYPRFRNNLREQMMVERVREREMQSRIKVSDAEIDEFVAQQRGAAAASDVLLNIAQVLVPVPEGASAAELAQAQAKAEQALARAKAGEDFAKLAAELGQGAGRERGGELGLRASARLPDLFVEAVRNLKPGELAGQVLRSGAGFHVLKLLERREDAGPTVTQTRARHILLRTTPTQNAEAAARKLETLRRDIVAGRRKFEDAAREVSEDGSAASGGDLGWVSPGVFVPEFEEAMVKLSPGAISAPVPSRFGVHLIQVVERREATLEAKELRDRARAALRERKYEQAYADWAKELRARAYVELREPPQ